MIGLRARLFLGRASAQGLDLARVGIRATTGARAAREQDRARTGVEPKSSIPRLGMAVLAMSLVAAVAFLATPAPARAADTCPAVLTPGDGCISGHVSDTDGRSLAGCSVTVSSVRPVQGSFRQLLGVTDSNG